MGPVLCVCALVRVRACFSAAVDLWNATEHLSSSYKDPCFNWRGYEHVALSFTKLDCCGISEKEPTLGLQKSWPGSGEFPQNVQTQRLQSLAKKSETFLQNPKSFAQSESSVCFWRWAESALFTSDDELLGGHEELVLTGGEQHSVPILVSYLQPLTLGLDSLGSCTETPSHVGPSEF